MTKYQPHLKRFFVETQGTGKNFRGYIVDSITSKIVEVRKSHNATLNSWAKHENKLINDTLDYLEREMSSVEFRIAFESDAEKKEKLKLYHAGLSSARVVLLARTYNPSQFSELRVS